ncbi:MAG: TonB family protein [Candidatus Sulfotelmatobacter sp.]
MSSLTDVAKKWEGRVVDGKFPLRQWLGASEHNAVFVTQRTGDGSQKATIKLIPADFFSNGNFDEAAQLAQWADSAKLSHPHLIRIFEHGRGKIDDRDFLYVVMEYAEENLAQILPQRPLSPDEVKEMLPPAAETLAFLHRAGLVHGHLKPANILAVGNQLKISTDSVRRTGERDKQCPNTFTAPEVAKTGPSPAADVWSLGATLVASLTQREPDIKNPASGNQVTIPESVPQPFRRIAERSLRVDPQQRCTINEILSQLGVPESMPVKAADEPLPAKRSNRWLIIIPVIVAVLLLAILFGRKSHRSPASSSENHAAESSTAPSPQSSVPPNDRATPAQTGIIHGRVLQEVPPDVSPGARRTITGHIRVSARVSVDNSGNVSGVTLVSPGPSKYFARQALAAARRWRFSPAQVNGQPSASEWILRFQFGRTSTQVSPTETKP